jgi:hypothetical protein
VSRREFHSAEAPRNWPSRLHPGFSRQRRCEAFSSNDRRSSGRSEGKGRSGSLGRVERNRERLAFGMARSCTTQFSQPCYAAGATPAVSGSLSVAHCVSAMGGPSAWRERNDRFVVDAQERCSRCRPAREWGPDLEAYRGELPAVGSSGLANGEAGLPSRDLRRTSFGLRAKSAPRS